MSDFKSSIALWRSRTHYVIFGSIQRVIFTFKASQLVITRGIEHQGLFRCHLLILKYINDSVNESMMYSNRKKTEN